MKPIRDIISHYGIATWAFLGFVFVWALVMNVFAIPAHDELALAFAGQSTPAFGECHRVSSLMDIMHQQWVDFHAANGRLLVHGIVACFAAFKLYYLFDVVNSFMWMIFVFVIMKMGGACQRNFISVVVCFGLAYLFCWYPETTFMNAAFAVNYLWVSIMTLLMLSLWRQEFSWFATPLFLLYGWTQETFVLPFIVAATVDLAVKSVHMRKVDWKRVFALALMTFGVSWLIFCPGAMRRASVSIVSLDEMFISILRALFGLVLSVWPVVLLGCVCSLIWIARREFKRFFLENLMLLAFIGASFGLFVLGCRNGVYRLLMPMFAAALVLVIKERQRLTKLARPAVAVAFLSVGFMSAAAYVQVDAGLANFEFLSRYKNDPQGVTYRRVVSLGIFANTCTCGLFKGWHNSLWRLEYGKPMAPINLNQYLYENLYLESDRFFAEAEEVGSGWYVTSRAGGIAVKKGRAEAESPPTFGKRSMNLSDLFPGRIRFMYPSESDDIDIPGCRVTITTRDCKMITLVQKK